MTYSNSSSPSGEDMSSNENNSQEDNKTLQQRANELFPKRKSYEQAEPNVDYFDEDYDYKNQRATRGANDNWDVGIDYFPGCNALSDETIEDLQEGDVGDFDDRQGRLPCTIMTLGGTDEEAFIVNELDSSLVRLEGPNGNDISIEDLKNLLELYPGIETIINALQNGNGVVPPSPAGPGVPTYLEANANVDEDGIGIPQFRLCECINYAYRSGWDYVDYDAADPYKGPIGAKSVRVRTVPFGPPQNKNNETHNPGRFQMHSERCNSWFKKEPRKFIYIWPEAGNFQFILGDQEWQSGPSDCDYSNDDVEYEEGVWTAPGGKNSTLTSRYPAHLKFKNKKGGNVMLFSMGHTFENLGGVEGQEYGVVGVSGWMVPEFDNCTENNLGQNYYANLGIKYVYTAYRFDSSIEEILLLIVSLGKLLEGIEEGEESNQEGRSGRNDAFVGWALDGTLDKLKEKKFSWNNEQDKIAIQLFIEAYCKAHPKNQGKQGLDVDYFIDDDKLFYALEQHEELNMLDLYEYVYPRTYIPERIFDVINMEFDVDKWIDWRLDDEEKEHGLLFEFLIWAFGKGATSVVKGEDGEIIATWDNTFSFTAEEYYDYYTGGWFDACVRSGGQIYGETQQLADGRSICPRYNCIKHKEVETEFDPEEPDALDDVEYTVLHSYELGENYTVMNGVLNEQEIENMYDPEFGDPSDGKTRGGAVANSGWHCTKEQAAVMHEWDRGMTNANGDKLEDLHIRCYASAGHTLQPDWTSNGDVAKEGTYEFSLSVPYVDEKGKNKTVNEMNRLYNWWNSNDDHQHGVTIFIGEKKDSTNANDWVHLTTLKGCGNGGTFDIKNEDARKYPDYHMGRPDKRITRYANYKYFRVAAFSNRRKVTLADGTTEWRGAKVDPSDPTWKNGKKARVKIWPNTTGLRPDPEDFVPQNSGPAYWTSAEHSAYDPNLPLPNEDRPDWTNHPTGALLYQIEHMFVSPCYTIPVQGNSVYEVKRVTSGDTQQRYPAPDLTIHFSTDAGGNNLDAYGDRDIVDFHEHWTTEDQVLPSHLTSEDIVRVRTPEGAKHMIFGAHNTERNLDQWSKKGEPWAIAQKVPNTRFVEGPMYWADSGNTKRLPPFNDKRWVEQLNRFVPYVEEGGPFVNLEVGKRYKLKRPRDVGEDNRTPYDVSVIQILNDDATYPRRNHDLANMRGNKWKDHFHVEPQDFTQTMNEFEFDCLSEHIVFGAYGHTRNVGQWSVNGEPVYFILEEVEVIKGPRYWANQKGNEITNARPEAMPPLDHPHWEEPNTPLTGWNRRDDDLERSFINGNKYRITAVSNDKNNNVLQGADLSIAWIGSGVEDVVKNVKTRWLAQSENNTIENLGTNQNQYPHSALFLSKGTSADDFATVAFTRENKTVEVEALGRNLYFGEHNFKIGYERNIESWEKKGEPFTIYAEDLGPVDHPRGPVYYGREVQLNNRAVPAGSTFVENAFWLEYNTDYRTVRVPDHPKQNNNLVGSLRIKDTEWYIQLTCGTISPRYKDLKGTEVFQNKKLYFFFMGESDNTISDDIAERWYNFKTKIHWQFSITPGGGFLLLNQSIHEQDILQVKNAAGNKEDAVLDPAKHTLTQEQRNFLERNYLEDLDKKLPDGLIYNGNAAGWMWLGSPCDEWLTKNMLVINYADQSDKFKEMITGDSLFWEGHDYVKSGDNCEEFLSFIYSVYDGTIPNNFQSWSRKGFPKRFSTFESMGTMGASYYADDFANPTNDPDVAAENCKIDFKYNGWDDRFTDARYDAGIKWKIELPDGEIKRKGQVADRNPYNEAGDDTPWATFNPGKTYKLKLTKNSNCMITPVIVTYQSPRIPLPPVDLPGGGQRVEYAYPELFDRTGGDHYNLTGHPFTDGSEQGYVKVTYLRDKTLKFYNTSDLVNDGQEVEITIPSESEGESMLFFACHTFDTARTTKLHRPDSLACWSKYGEITEIEVTYVGMKDRGPVYYAANKNIKKIDEDPGEIDFSNSHWITPWNAFDPDEGRIQTNKCYEISLLPFDQLDRDIESYEQYQNPPLNRPEWTNKFSLWFFTNDKDKKITNFERGYYLEPTPAGDTILEEIPIELDGEFSTTPYRWVAQFRAPTDNLVFGVYTGTEGAKSTCVSMETHDGAEPTDEACAIEEWSKKGAPGQFYIREIPDPDAEIPDGWAYWADTNEGKDGIDWYNTHWSNPLRTVAPDRVAGGRWYRITAHKDIPPNYFYRLWWSADEHADDKNHRDNEYLMLGEQASKCVSHEGEPGNVIRFGRTIEFYLPGKHLFFAAYNVNDRNKLTDWNRDAEPAPVLLEEIDTPDWVVRGSSYFATQQLGFFPDFTNDYWQQVNDYKKHAHKLSYSDKNTGVEIKTSFPALELKADHMYRFRDAGLQLNSQGMREAAGYEGVPGDPVQNPAPGEAAFDKLSAEEVNANIWHFFDNYVWMTDNRQMLETGSGNRPSNWDLDGVIKRADPETKVSTPYYDLKKAMRYVVFGTDTGAPKLGGADLQLYGIEDWSPFGNPMLCQIEDLGDYKKILHGPAYWAEDFGSNIPDFRHDKWLNAINYEEIVDAGTRWKITLKESMKGKGSYKVCMLSDVNKFDMYDDFGLPMPVYTAEGSLNYDNQHGGKRSLEFTVPTGEPFYFLSFGAFRQAAGRNFDNWSIDGEPCEVELEELGDIVGPGYFGDDRAFQHDNIPNFKDGNIWEEINSFGNKMGSGSALNGDTSITLKIGNTYRMLPILDKTPEENTIYTYRVLQHDTNASLNVGPTHDGKITPLEMFGPKIRHTDLKHITATEFTFGTDNAEILGDRTLEDWSKKGEPVPFDIQDLGKIEISGPGYWAPNNGLYKPDWNNSYWLSPLNYRSGPGGRDFVKNKSYTLKATERTKGILHIFWVNDDADLYTHVRTNDKFVSASEGEQFNYLAWDGPEQTSKELTLRAKGGKMIFGVFGQSDRKSMEDWSRDGEPVVIEIEEAVIDDTVQGPLYWGDIITPGGANGGYPEGNDFWARDTWWEKPFRTVPESKMRPVIGGGAKVTYQAGKTRPQYDVEMWFAKDRSVLTKDRDLLRDGDLIYAGRWLRKDNFGIINNVPNAYLLFSTLEADDRDVLEDWSSKGEPYDVNLEVYENKEGPTYWADYVTPPAGGYKKGQPNFNEDHWKQIYTLQYFVSGLYDWNAFDENDRVIKAPYDLYVWEMEVDGVPAAQLPSAAKKPSNWRLVCKLPKGSRRKVTGQIESKKAQVVIGAMKTGKNLEDWSPYGEPPVVGAVPGNVVEGPILFAAAKGTGKPPHNQFNKIMPDWANKKWWKPFNAAGKRITKDEETGASVVEPFLGGLEYEIKIKKGSGKYKIKGDTFMSVYGINQEMHDWTGTSVHNPAHTTPFGCVGIKKKSKKGSSSRKGSNSGGGNNNNSGGGGGRAPGKKLTFRPFYGKTWLMFGQYWADKPYTMNEWSPAGHPLTYKIKVTSSIPGIPKWLAALIGLIKRLLGLLTQIPNLISLARELDILIEQNIKEAYDEMDYSKNADVGPLKDFCRWTHGTPLYFNTTCDDTNKALVKILKLRYNGIFVHATSEKTSSGKAEWRVLHIMNLTPTFSHGIFRMTAGEVDAQKTNRMLRHYSNSDLDIPRPWGREYENFFRVDTRMDNVTQSASFDFKRSWFNPQLAWGHRAWAGKYYKVLHDTQYQSATAETSVGGYADGEYTSGNTLNDIFYNSGFSFTAVQGDTRASDINCATFEIMAGGDRLWPNCGGFGLPTDQFDDTTTPSYFWPGLQFDYSYTNFSTKTVSKDFQILNFILYFYDEDDNVKKVKLYPEKSSGYLFRDTMNPSSKDSGKDAFGQKPSGTKMRLWAENRYGGMSIINSKLFKMTITIFIKGASRSKSVFGFNISELQPLASAEKIPTEYLIYNKSDLEAEDPGEWPGFMPEPEPPAD